MKVLLVIFIMASFASCVTYDSPIIYSKDYIIGDNSSLMLDGYYAKVDSVKGAVKGPCFFYSDGTVKLWPGTSSLEKVDSLLSTNHDWGKVGNYQVHEDTINVEYWNRDSGTVLYAKRVVLQFKIENGSIIFLGHLNSEKELKTVQENKMDVFNFYYNSMKPDSSSNWIRENRKWNR